MIYTYTLTKEEEVNLELWVTEINSLSSSAKKVTAKSEIDKIVSRFLLSVTQKYQKKADAKLDIAFNKADDATGQQVKLLLKMG